MIQLNEQNKISVAPHFFNYSEYFRELNKFFRRWMAKQIAKIEKKYGKECMQRIDKREIPIDEQTEKRMKSTLKGEKLKEWEKKEMNCFLAFVEFNDLATQHKAFHHSFLIYIFSDFENILDEICKEYSRKTKQNILLKDISGRGIERSINYLNKVARFTLPDEKLKEEIFLMRDIRNCLAHSGGVLNTTDLLNKIKKSAFLKVLKDDYSENQSIFFDERYCKYAIKMTSKFLELLAKKNNRYLIHWSTQR